MRQTLSRSRWLALLAVLALVLAACGDDATDDVEGDADVGDEDVDTDDDADVDDDPADDDDEAVDDEDEAVDDDDDAAVDDEDADDDAEVADGGEFSIYNCEPQTLITGDSSEVCGSSVLEQLYSGLTVVNYETSEAEPMVAEDWETEDNVEWTFTLRDDFTFHNGEPVTAQTFVDTWNWVVDPDNAQGGAGFFDVIEGYEEVVSGETDELSGVSAPDDTTLEITMAEPFSVLPVMLSYTAFYPLPDEAFEDIDAFNEAPIGNGRYEMDGEWEHDVEIAMTRYEDWPGDVPGVADRIVWQIYDDVNTAYLDTQAGNLDVLSGIPPEFISTVDQDFGDNWDSFESSSFSYLGFPLYQDDFADENVRKAISMAIDREAVIDAIFDGAMTPATAVIPPVLAQHREDACEYCDYDPDTALELWEESDGIEEPLEFWFNSGAGHEDWTEAVANQLQQNLGIESVEFNSLEFNQYLDLHDEREITGPYRLGWVLSYPSPQYAMEPIYATDRDSNYMEYSNEEFDGLLREANGADTPEEADDLYQQAEDILLEDLPIAPLWYGLEHTVWSDNVSGVEVDPRTFVRVEQIEINE